MTSFFQTAILSISRHCTEIKKDIFVILRSNWFRNTHFLFEKIENLTLCDRGLTWPFSVVDLHGFRLQNGFNFWILREKVTINHVPHARKRIFDSGDLSWSALDPEPYLVWHLCSQGIFNSPLRLVWLSFEQNLSTLPALGLVIRKHQILTFDLTLTRDSR